MDRSNTLLGQDTDTNGIRDDIDKLIAGWQLVPAQSAAMRQTAKVFQALLKDNWQPPVNAERLAAANNLMNQMRRSAACRVDVFEELSALKEYSDKLEAATFNTRERTKTYIAHGIAISGGVFSSQRPNVCDQ